MNSFKSAAQKLGITLGLTVALASSALAGGQYTTMSFLNPQVSSIVVSNGLMGVTNLSTIAQNQTQGLYQAFTNSLGTGFNLPIATNWCSVGLMYTNATPVTWYGVPYIGTFVALTNNTVGTATNDVSYTLVNTNNAFNFFQDLNLPQDFFQTLGETGIGAATTTNSIAYLQIVSQPFSLTGYAAGAGSNQVTLVFTPIATVQQPQPANGGPISGFVAGLEPTDGAATGGNNWVVTYTNQISTIRTPTVVNVPVPRWKFPGARGIRLRSISTDVATNAISINSVTLNTWVP